MAISLHNSGVATPSGLSVLVGPSIAASIGEIIVVQLNHEAVSGAVPIITGISDGTANVYHKRFAATQAPEPIFGASEGFEVWWAYAANALTGLTPISVTLSASTDDAVVVAAGYQGFTGTAYQTAPWDTNVSIPATAQSTGATSVGSVSGVSTTSTAGMLLFGHGSCDWNLSPPGPGAPTGFTLVQRATNTGGSNANQGNLFGKAYTSAQSSVTITTTSPSTTQGWIVWADALTDQGAAGDTLMGQQRRLM